MTPDEIAALPYRRNVGVMLANAQGQIFVGQRIDNDQVIAYRKWSDDRRNHILVVVNLDPDHRQESTVHLPLEAMGLTPGQRFAVEDLIYGDIYHWQQSSNYVALDPRSKPVHVFLVHAS